MLLGCIADDLTGATDLAGMLGKYGMQDPPLTPMKDSNLVRVLAAQTPSEVALVDAGVRQLVVAGGETSGAVVKALEVQALRIGPEIDPGVPWTKTIAEGERPSLALALKSGNFGTPDFFLKAFDRLLDSCSEC